MREELERRDAAGASRVYVELADDGTDAVSSDESISTPPVDNEISACRRK